MNRRLARALRSGHELGASAVEYGLMVAAIAALVVGIAFGLGGIVRATFEQTQECIETLQNGPNCG